MKLTLETKLAIVNTVTLGVIAALLIINTISPVNSQTTPIDRLNALNELRKSLTEDAHFWIKILDTGETSEEREAAKRHVSEIEEQLKRVRVMTDKVTPLAIP